jgi:hypothetical protein
MYHLYSGSKFLPPPNVYPPSIQDRHSPVEPLQWENDVDITRIDGLVTHNTFSPNNVSEVLLTFNTREEYDKWSAIYTLPSMFSHSCHSNAMWNCFSDVMVIRGIVHDRQY